MSKTKQLPFVAVEWEDAWGDSHSEVTIEQVAELHKPKLMITEGRLLASDETGVSLFNERSPEDGTYRGRTFIPRGMIVSVIHYRLTKKNDGTKSKRPRDVASTDEATAGTAASNPGPVGS
jgi:hypothetical protein